MHTIVKRAVVVNDQIVIRPMMYVALSYDHRIIDGKEAVLFLVHLKQNLEDPARLLLDYNGNFDLIVIGSGPGGYVAAIRAAQLGLKTACIEKRKELGGTCLNVGCIPSKALLQSSENYWNALHHSKEHGIDIANVGLNFAQMMHRKQKVVTGFNEGIAGLFKKNQDHPLYRQRQISLAEHRPGRTRELTAKNILIATGSEPISLPFLAV